MTVQVEVLTGEQYEIEDSSGIVDLIEAIRIQSTGPMEASRALRKKLLVINPNPKTTNRDITISNTHSSKYGNVHRQLRALTILDFLIQNTGSRFLREFADEPLLERLRIAATDPVSDRLVKEKCKQLFGQWSVTYKNTPGMERVAALYKQLPRRKQPANQAKAKVLRDSTASEGPQMGHVVSVATGNGPSTVVGGSKHKHSASKLKAEKKEKEKQEKQEKKEKRMRYRSFNFEREKSQMLQTLASSSVASTNLLNALKLVNRETHRVSEDAEVLNRFEACKQLRRQVLRYIQFIENEEYLGGLIHANEELVTALMAYEVLNKSVDDDSDSDQDVLAPGWSPRDPDETNESFAGLVVNPPKPPRPPRPMSLPVLPSASSSAAQKQNMKGIFDDSETDSETDSEGEEDEDEDDNPFGDRNAISRPAVGNTGRTW